MNRLFSKTKKKQLFVSKSNNDNQPKEKRKSVDSNTIFNPFINELSNENDEFKWFDKMTIDSGEVMLTNDNNSLKSISSFQFSQDGFLSEQPMKKEDSIDKSVVQQPVANTNEISKQPEGKIEEKIEKQQNEESLKKEGKKEQEINKEDIKNEEKVIKDEIKTLECEIQIKKPVEKKNTSHIPLKKFTFTKPNLRMKPLKDRMKDTARSISEKCVYKSMNIQTTPKLPQNLQCQQQQKENKQETTIQTVSEPLNPNTLLKQRNDFNDQIPNNQIEDKQNGHVQTTNSSANIKEETKELELDDLIPEKRKLSAKELFEEAPPAKKLFQNIYTSEDDKFDIPLLGIPILFTTNDSMLESLKRIYTVCQMLNYAPINKELQTNKVIILPEIQTLPKPITEEEIKKSLTSCKKRIESLGTEIESLLPITCVAAETVLGQIKRLNESKQSKNEIIMKQEEEIKMLGEALKAEMTMN